MASTSARDKAVMQRVRRVLGETGENMHALAKRTGLNYFTLRRWDLGEVVPTRESLEQLAAALGVSLVWLEFGVGDQHPEGERPCEAAQ